jgi:uncharacterized repeat protein (TIGR03803 family)
MKLAELRRNALGICAAAALLAGCGGAQPPIGAPGAMPQRRPPVTRADSTNYTIVYSFAGSPDGAKPTASLIDVGGKLYGTTSEGGLSTSYDNCREQQSSCGTVFRVTTSGTEKVLHRFGFQDDGGAPLAGLVDVGGMLYGTTTVGGGYADCGQYTTGFYGCGTVFSITPGGTEKVLHSFAGRPSDGQSPYASMTDVKGTLYGTTRDGGSSHCATYGHFYRVSCGTVFSITTGGTETMVYSFGRGRLAHWPQARLIEEGRKLYGTTVGGGAYSYGTVFSISPGGEEKVVHSFGQGADGIEPVAGLIEVKGTFYGTTLWSCNFCAGAYKGWGTVFSVTQSGTEKVLHRFSAGTDGANPRGPLTEMNGTLYGTTAAGGAYESGTVFSITPSGREKVLHSFGAGTDGSDPVSGLIEVAGTLYGTTASGGTYGSGTVFALTP